MSDPSSQVLQNTSQIFAKIYETKYIHIYYEIHYEIWAVLHHLEDKIVFKSKKSMKRILALKNSQNIYFHSKTHSASAVTRSGDDWTQVQSKHKIGQIGIDYHPFVEIT